MERFLCISTFEMFVIISTVPLLLLSIVHGTTLGK